MEERADGEKKEKGPGVKKKEGKDEIKGGITLEGEKPEMERTGQGQWLTV